MSMPGISELIVIFGVLVLLFGGKKLPELGGALGESIRNFRKGMKDLESSRLENIAHNTDTEHANSSGLEKSQPREGKL